MNVTDNSFRDGLAKAFEELEGLLEKVPGSMADDIRKKLKGTREMLLDQRPPRFALVGRRGSGKSSLINAIFGEQVAKVGHEKAQTGRPKWYMHRGARGALEFLDTRGLQEGHAPDEADEAESALDSIFSEIKKQCPDAVLFLVKATEADAAIDEDLAQLTTLNKRMYDLHGARVPILAVLTQCDVLEPKNVALHRQDDCDPADWREKSDRVKRLENQVGDKIRAQPALRDAYVVTLGVSCYQSWRTDGSRRGDDRWRVTDLVEYLFEELPKEARIELVRLAQVRKLQLKIAKTLITLVASACAGLAATPIPVADIVPITSLQVALIAGIGYISGRTLTLKTAGEFLTALGVNVGAGFVLREGARALIKFVFPGGGSLISAGVAFAGTVGIGAAATAYFIEGRSIEDAKSAYGIARSEAPNEHEK